jgi:hypothetical protein
VEEETSFFVCSVYGYVIFVVVLFGSGLLFGSVCCVSGRTRCSGGCDGESFGSFDTLLTIKKQKTNPKTTRTKLNN